MCVHVYHPLVTPVESHKAASQCLNPCILSLGTIAFGESLPGPYRTHLQNHDIANAREKR